MIIKSETIAGETYLLDDNLGVWCVTIGPDGSPTIQHLDTIYRGEADILTRPIFYRWVAT